MSIEIYSSGGAGAHPRSPSSFYLGDRIVEPIRSDQIPPGSLICTVELTSLNAINLTIISLQWLKGLFSGSGRNIHNLVHWEIVTKPLLGNMLEVAHASGLSKTVLRETQRIDAFPPGTLLVAFAPDDPVRGERLAEIARQTSNRGNRWRIRGLSREDREMSCFSLARLENRELLATWVVDRHEKGEPLLKDDGTLADLSCLEYVQAVLNIEALEQDVFVRNILRNTLLLRTEKISKIAGFLSLSQWDAFNSALPSDLALRLLNNPKSWTLAGYMGKGVDFIHPSGDKAFVRPMQHPRQKRNQELLENAQYCIHGAAGAFYAFCAEKVRLGETEYAGAAGIAAVVQYAAVKLLGRWSSLIDSAYRMQNPTDQLILETDQIRYGERPWVMFSGSPGEWSALPLDKVGDLGKVWSVGVRASGDTLEYKFFIGRWEPNAQDPLQGAIWQGTSSGGNVVVKFDEQLKNLPLTPQGLRMHHCTYPSWVGR